MRRLLIVSGALAVALLAPAAYAAGASATATDGSTATSVSGTRLTLTANERAMFDLINRARVRRGLHRLALRASLCRAAVAHSREMLSYDYFSHYSRDGTSYVTRVLRFGYARSGYSLWCAGEVIGLGSGLLGTPQYIFRKWMHSSGHRARILTAMWRDVGVGCRTGSYGGFSGVRVYTVDFGRRGN